jgi:hypothetical protein
MQIIMRSSLLSGRVFNEDVEFSHRLQMMGTLFFIRLYIRRDFYSLQLQ